MNAIVKISATKPTFIERVVSWAAPGAIGRIAQRVISGFILRSGYDAAGAGRRTKNWATGGASGPNSNGGSLSKLRDLARDLERNSGWARGGIDEIVNNTIGWGIKPRSKNKLAVELWNKWANSKEADFHGRMNFYGLQALAMRTVVTSGEVLIQKHNEPTKSGIPLRIELLEPDHLDTSRDQVYSFDGNRIVQGIEIDAGGRRVAYWILRNHPSDEVQVRESIRVPADKIIHLLRPDRPGQLRGVSWLAAAITKLREFDEYEDALLVLKKIASCAAVFVTDIDGTNSTIGLEDEDDDELETFEPGGVHYLKGGKDVKFNSPPNVPDNEVFTKTVLRRIAKALGVTYEALSGDYSNVNFSSSRMGRIAHYQNVHSWRWHMVIPLLCEGTWDWFEDLAIQLMLVDARSDSVQWTPPPTEMIDPDKEVSAKRRAIRTGLTTLSEAIAEQGRDPEELLDEYANDMKLLDNRKIKLDCDARSVSDAGQIQQEAAEPGKKPIDTKKKPISK